MLGYWPRVVWRALHDTRVFFGWNRRILAVPVLAVIGVGVQLLLFGADAVINEFKVTLSYAVVPILLFGVGLLLWNLVTAPARMDRELRREKAALLDRIRSHEQFAISVYVQYVEEGGALMMPGRADTVLTFRLGSCRIVNRSLSRAASLEFTLQLPLRDTYSGIKELRSRHIYTMYIPVLNKTRPDVKPVFSPLNLPREHTEAGDLYFAIDPAIEEKLGRPVHDAVQRQPDGTIVTVLEVADLLSGRTFRARVPGVHHEPPLLEPI